MCMCVCVCVCICVCVYTQGRQYLFEATFFLAVDSSLVNIPLSACLTYVVSRLLTWLLANASKNNLSDKTLVDHHFLI